MALPAWPTTIPQRFQPDGFELEPRPQTIRTEPDILPIRARRRSTIDLHQVTGQILLDNDQRLAFLEFYNTTLFGGVHTFSWVHPLDETQAVRMKFLSNPRVRLVGSLQYVLRVELQMQVVE